MIRLLFIMPHESAQADIEKVLSIYSCNEEISYRCKICTYLELENYSPEWPCDAIITRGFSADVVAPQFPYLPVIKLEFSSSEVIEAMMICRNQYASRRIGVIGYPSLAVAADTIQKISDMSIKVFIVDTLSRDRIPQMVRQALADGCDTIIGGGVVYHYARSLHANAHMVLPSADTLWRSVNEAVNAIRIQRQERIKTHLLKKIIDHSQGGFILTKPDGNLLICSRYAQQLFDYDAQDEAPPISLFDLAPELTDAWRHASQSGSAVDNVLLKRKGVHLTVSVRPLIIEGTTDSILIFLDDVGKIENLEHQIRNKLYAKNMVTQYSFQDIINSDAKTKHVVVMARKFAMVDSSLLITGETGTGKELFAQSIHAAGNRNAYPFVAVNCAAIPENLLESELFGYAPGAFTGANKNGKHGLFESAHKGTLFLDEVSELPLLFQSKLLRVLQEREVRRVGDSQVIPIDIRVVCACNRDLSEMVENNLFRRDLYYRLNVLAIHLPPLRDRFEDIVPLFYRFVRQFSAHFNKTPPDLAWHEREILNSARWPGNVRELKNVAERFVVLFDPSQAQHDLLHECMQAALPPPAVCGAESTGSLSIGLSSREREKSRILAALEASATYAQAAQLLSISRSTLYRKMKTLGLPS